VALTSILWQQASPYFVLEQGIALAEHLRDRDAEDSS